MTRIYAALVLILTYTHARIFRFEHERSKAQVFFNKELQLPPPGQHRAINRGGLATLSAAASGFEKRRID